MMAEYKEQMGFFFTEDSTSPCNFAYYYHQYKRTLEKLQKLRMSTATPPEFPNEYYASFCRLREFCKKLNFPKPKTKNWSITEEQIDDFLRRDRYVSANLLLKELIKERNQKISESRKRITQEYNEKMKSLREFTMRGKKKHE